MYILDWTFTLNQLKPVIVCRFIAQRKQPREDPEKQKHKLWPLSDESFLFVTYPLASTGRILSVLMCLCRTWIAEFWVWIQMLGLLTQLPVHFGWISLPWPLRLTVFNVLIGVSIAELKHHDQKQKFEWRNWSRSYRGLLLTDFCSLLSYIT